MAAHSGGMEKETTKCLHEGKEEQSSECVLSHSERQDGFKGTLLLQEIPCWLLLCFHCSIFHLSFPERQKDATCPNPTQVSVRSLAAATWACSRFSAWLLQEKWWTGLLPGRLQTCHFITFYTLFWNSSNMKSWSFCHFSLVTSILQSRLQYWQDHFSCLTWTVI